MEKQFAHNKKLRESDDCEWLLLYPDFDLVLHIPGTQEPFSVEKYKESIGRPYSRVNLYLCRVPDFESKKYVDMIQCTSLYLLSYTSLQTLWKQLVFIVFMQITLVFNAFKAGLWVEWTNLGGVGKFG